MCGPPRHPPCDRASPPPQLRVFVDEPEAFIVEASDGLRVGKWEASYPELAGQFALASINPAGPNHWSRVYDFSPNPDGKAHWSFLPDQDCVRPSLLQPLPSGLCGGEVIETAGCVSRKSAADCPALKPISHTWTGEEKLPK